VQIVSVNPGCPGHILQEVAMEPENTVMREQTFAVVTDTEHGLIRALKAAGLTDALKEKVVASEDNALAKEMVRMIASHNAPMEKPNTSAGVPKEGPYSPSHSYPEESSAEDTMVAGSAKLTDALATARVAHPQGEGGPLIRSNCAVSRAAEERGGLIRSRR